MQDRIKKLRKALGLTQQEFADRIHVKNNTISNYESGSRSLSDAMIASICREFGVSEVWLRSGEGEMFVELGRMAEITRRVAQMAGEDNPFKEKLILALLRIPPDKWCLIEQAAREILAENEKDPDD
jgi:transcriptional regulator with XRE-family HTH domain